MSNKGASTKLYIGNLPDLCRTDELKARFEKYGNIVEFDILSNFGFVHYGSPEEARAAADALNNMEYNGKQLKVEISHSRVRQKAGMGERETCFRCGQEGHWSRDCPKGPRRPRPPAGRGRDPYDDDPYDRDPYDRDPYADYYYRARLPPPPPSYLRYDPYDPYDRRPYPVPRDPYLRERLADPYARDYYARRPTLSAGDAAERDPYAKDPYAGRDPYAPAASDPYAKDPYAKDPYANRDPYAAAAKDPYANRDPYAAAAKDPYAAPAKDPYDDYLERRRAYAAAVRPAPYPKPATVPPGSEFSSGAPTSANTTQSSRVPGPY